MNERNSVEVKVIDLDDRYPPASTGLKVLVWLETPVNPTGECRDIRSCNQPSHSSSSSASSFASLGNLNRCLNLSLFFWFQHHRRPQSS